jgi:drug/metabolite transporter (DMT)-like permease
VIVFLAIVIFGGALGDIAISHAMKQIGEVTALRPGAIMRAVLRALGLGWFWVGIFLMSIAFFSLLALLSWADVSFVVPATALTYVAAALGGKFLLHEDVAPERWAGVVLVCVGVALLSL